MANDNRVRREIAQSLRAPTRQTRNAAQQIKRRQHVHKPRHRPSQHERENDALRRLDKQRAGFALAAHVTFEYRARSSASSVGPLPDLARNKASKHNSTAPKPILAQ